MARNTHISRALAPEDVRPGDYIAPLQVVVEHTRLPWECSSASPANELVRTLQLPGGTTPVLVLAVCLPFVLVQTAKGKHCTLDVRRYRLARVAETFGQRVFAQFAAERSADEKQAAEPAAETKGD